MISDGEDESIGNGRRRKLANLVVCQDLIDCPLSVVLLSAPAGQGKTCQRIAARALGLFNASEPVGKDEQAVVDRWSSAEKKDEKVSPGRPELVILALLNETACEERRRAASEPFLRDRYGLVPVILQTVHCHGNPILAEADAGGRDEVDLLNQKAGEVIALARGNLVASLHRLVEAVKKRVKEGKRACIVVDEVHPADAIALANGATEEENRGPMGGPGSHRPVLQAREAINHALLLGEVTEELWQAYQALHAWVVQIWGRTLWKFRKGMSASRRKGARKGACRRKKQRKLEQPK